MKTRVYNEYTFYADDKNHIERIGDDIFVSHEYKKVFEGYEKDHRLIIVDVGACVGLFSIYASPYAKAIYAVEPFKKSFDYLVRNIEVNKIDYIYPSNVGIFDSIGPKKMYEDYCFEGNRVADDGTHDITTTTLATFFTEHGIDSCDILKVDTEGAELQIFRSPDFETIAPKIKRIAVEIHGVDTDDLLLKHGFIKVQAGSLIVYRRD